MRKPDVTAELELYAILQEEPGGRLFPYNALLRELVSFEHALDHLMSWRSAIITKLLN